MKRIFLCLATLVVQLFMLTSCEGVLFEISSVQSEQTPDGFNQYSSNYTFLADDAPANLSNQDKDLVSGLNSFAFKLAGLITNNESFVTSPASLSVLLGMVSSGAAGETRDEICEVLGLKDKGQTVINSFFRDLIAVSQKGTLEGESLVFANMLVADNGFPLLESYKKQAKNYYDALVVNKDFAKDNMAEYINGWVDKQTHGVIEKLFEQFPSNIDNILLNSLYFNAVWEFPFAPSSPSDFTLSDGSTKKLEMMKSLDKPYVRYAETERFRMVRYPFGVFAAAGTAPKAGDFELDILLPPTRDGVNNLIKNLTVKEYSEAIANSAYRYVFLSFPKFEVSTREKYNDLLNSLGVKALFFKPDLSNLTTNDYISVTVEQVAKISFDETGAQAAAVSYEFPYGNSESDPNAPIYFTCDRPFAFIIRQNSTGAILFIGSFNG